MSNIKIAIPCHLPINLKKYLEFFQENKTNFCISGGYSVYRAGFTHSFNDIDIFINDFNFDEDSFLKVDTSIETIPYTELALELQVDTIVLSMKKRFGVTVNCGAGDIRKIDFVVMNCPKYFENNYLFSECVTREFDMDVCRISIINIDNEYRLIFNSDFKIFIKSECKNNNNDEDIELTPNVTLRRHRKYEERLKVWYRIFFTHCSPVFHLDRLINFHQQNVWTEGITRF